MCSVALLKRTSVPRLHYEGQPEHFCLDWIVADCGSLTLGYKKTPCALSRLLTLNWTVVKQLLNVSKRFVYLSCYALGKTLVASLCSSSSSTLQRFVWVSSSWWSACHSLFLLVALLIKSPLLHLLPARLPCLRTHSGVLVNKFPCIITLLDLLVMFCGTNSN